MGDVRKWSRLAVLLSLGLLVGACGRLLAAEPTPAGEIYVTLTDNVISPSTIRVQAGQRVRFIVTNEGAHTHEFMIGQDPVATDDYLDLSNEVYEPFEVDFFDGLDVSVTGTGMPMNFAGMPEMDMGGDQAEDEPAGAMEGMEDEEMEGMEDGDGMGDMEMGDDQPEEGEEGEAGHGAMVMLDPGRPGAAEPGQTSIIELVIPEDRVGTWQIGCFQQAGQHWADGMRATLIVER